MDKEETILETSKGDIKIITYNKPKRKNAIDVNMYLRVTKILNDVTNDDNISMVVLTGSGEYYSSGNDLSAVKPQLLNILQDFIQAFITFPKLLVAIVNGPAVGIAATTLGLCDLVFASENSFFYTPFTKLGFVAEGCSTFTFPRLIGERKATEMLVYSHKMSAKEALDLGFVNYLYKPEELQNKVWDRIIELSKLPKCSILGSKKLLRSVLQDELTKTNQREIEELGKILFARDHLNSQPRRQKSKM